jgi:uncharacterized DUF497 family protein
VAVGRYFAAHSPTERALLQTAVIFIDEGDVRRVISGRRANRKETKQWLASG